MNVYSMLSNGSYGTDSGTSMAAPLVTGTVALVEAAHPTWSMSQVIDAVLDTVTPDPALAGKVTTGGIVNVGAAVANTDGPYVVSSTPERLDQRQQRPLHGATDLQRRDQPRDLHPAQVTIDRPRRRHPERRDRHRGRRLERPRVPVSFPAQTAAGTTP